ncbi:bifunctional DNA primase/polymerase [Streptomyces violens]|uniref:bifunctional DNA primase/polymerase n=1 Tax=Streptomyces violens TaxID=66377 RepID=UPI000A93FCA7|nr:bifunctional DNA primase/polymerase [Streptomyces violens]
MSDWPQPPAPDRHPASFVTLAGADWLASASPHPRRVHHLWATHPTAPSVLPCGTVFDVINAPALFGRRMADCLWAAGPGSGPVAMHRGRLLLFAARGTAQRLPALLSWEEWARSVPPMLCHGAGDAVSIPPLHPLRAAPDAPPPSSRWLVAPDVRHPWLPGPDVLLWACVRAARTAPEESPATPDAVRPATTGAGARP